MKRTALLFALALLLVACGGDQAHNQSVPDESLTTRLWSPVAGAATIAYQPELPFLQFIAGLDISALPQAAQGRELFIADWTMAPGSRELLDGLGPLFVAQACDSCHLPDRRAAALNDDGSIGTGLLFRLGDEYGNPDPHFGGQLQNRATVGNPEGTVSWTDGGQGKPIFHIVTADGNLAKGIALGPRQSPQLTGTGLLNLVPETQILQWQDSDDANQDGISGRAHRLYREGRNCLGRFGWKAMHCTLRGQSAGAFLQDMGLTSPPNPDEPCTDQQPICAQQPSGGSPEVSERSLAAINEFLTLLAVPERRISNIDDFNRGADLFEQSGCDACHRPTLITGEHPSFAQLSHQTIYAYTDLLLHDMGDALADGVREGDASSREWKTPPLWGLGLLEGQGESRFLHDGRAKTLEQAILWHGGEADSSRRRYQALNYDERQLLLQFLRSI